MNKKLLLSTLGVLLIVLLSSTAFAALTVTDFTLGSESTQRDNPLADDEDDEAGDVVSATFTISNNDTSDVTGVAIDFGALDTQFSLNYTVPSTIPASGSQAVTVTGVIPKDWDSKTTDGNEEVAITAGTFSVSGLSVAAVTGTMKAQAEAGLSLDDVTIIIDGDSYDYDDDEVEEIPPDADLRITFNVDNEFDKDTNLEIEDVQVSLDSDNGDVDFDNDDDEFDIKEKDTETFSTDFDIDDDLEDNDDAKITVTISGTDDNGATHTIELEFDMEFQYLSNDISIKNVRATPSSGCPGEKISVGFKVENVGTDDQKSLRSQIEQSDLKWDKTTSMFRIDGRDDEDTEDEFVSETFTIPANTEAGTYKVKVTTYYEDDDGDDDAWKYEELSLIVTKCETETTTTTPITTTPTDTTTSGSDSGSSGMVVDDGTSTTTTSTTTSTTTAGDKPVTTSSSGIVATAKPSSSGSGLLVAGLVVLIIILIGVFVSMILMFNKK